MDQASARGGGPSGHAPAGQGRPPDGRAHVVLLPRRGGGRPAPGGNPPGGLGPLLAAPRGGPAAAPARSERARRAYRRRRLAALVTVGGIPAVLVVGILRMVAPVPAVAVSTVGPAASAVGGTAPALPWPATGGAAVAVPAAGVVVQSAAELPVPVASLTKIMTAYLVLRDHPLGPHAQGPAITMTAADVAESSTDYANGDTAVPVTAGERLTERQLLDGLIVHSANDFADTLARWDAGSVAAFVAKMNAEAAALGMGDTHYVDTNGIDDGSVSTAADQLRLAERAMAIPAFAAVADQPVVTEPLAGPLHNYVSAVGTVPGVVGIKSGFTQAAMGCLVLAAQEAVDGRPVLVLAATTGQPGADPLDAAQSADLALVRSAATDLARGTVVAAGAEVATVRARWQHSGVPLRTARAVTMLVWPGSTVHRAVTTARLQDTVRAGTVVGRLTVAAGGQTVRVPLVAAGGIGSPGLWWRLWH